MQAFEESARTIISSLQDLPKKTRGKRGLFTTPFSSELLSNVQCAPFPSDNESAVEVTEEDRLGISAGILQYGTDALAFYKPIHFKDCGPVSLKDKWGIFIYDWAIPWLTNTIAEIARTNQFDLHPQVARTLATKTILFHEGYHHLLERWILSHELVSRKRLYEYYVIELYSATRNSAACVEETLANRYAYDLLPDDETKSVVKSFMGMSPSPYDQFDESEQSMEDRRILLNLQTLYFGVNEKQRTEFYPREMMKKKALIDWEFFSSALNSERAITAALDHPFGIFPLTLDLMPPNSTGELLCPVYILKGIQPGLLVAPLMRAPNRRLIERFIRNGLNGEIERVTDHVYYRIYNGELVKLPNHHKGDNRLKAHEFQNILAKADMRPSEFEEQARITNLWKRKNIVAGVPMRGIK